MDGKTGATVAAESTDLTDVQGRRLVRLKVGDRSWLVRAEDLRALALVFNE